jgi:YesN/AraC family two-component response regulator
MRVLIVEDDEASRNYLKDTLESQGFETHVAENGWLGLEAYRRLNPYLVLSDIRIPKMDGLKLLEEIRKVSRKTIVVIITAFGCEEYAIKALRLRANNYLKKPIRHKELLPILRKFAAVIDSKTAMSKDAELTNNFKFSMEIGNDIQKVSNIANELTLKAGEALDENDKLDVHLGLLELLTNSIEHGNLKISPMDKAEALEKGPENLYALFRERMADTKLSKRKVTINFQIKDAYCEWVVSDEGDGFDWKSYMKQMEMGALQMEGKGLLICKYHFDYLEFLSQGNIVQAKKLKSLK